MIFIKKTLAFASFVTLLSGAFAPVAFAQGTDIVGNGALSSSNVIQTNNQTDTTVQNNSASFNNSIDVSSNTGDNTANYNTGGNVGIGTGNSVTGVQVTNMANLNMANPNTTGVNGTNLVQPEMPVAISGNGAGSANTFSSTNTRDQSLYQTNTADFSNSVAVSSNTGGNSAAYGTNGNTTIMTGQSQTGIGIQNTANGNVAGVTSVADTISPLVSGGTSGTSIMNNGALSANNVGVSNTSNNLTEQFNDAVINNSVAVAANTGVNTADQNTGGSQMVATGMATLSAGISNLANFNSASLPSDSWMNTVDPIVYGNGAYSANSVDLAQSKTNALYQGSGEGNGNQFTANNALVFTPTTGTNTTSLNTLPRTGISEVLSGTSASNVTVQNSGNVNSAGTTLGSFTLPGGMQMNLGFNLGNLMHLF